MAKCRNIVRRFVYRAILQFTFPIGRPYDDSINFLAPVFAACLPAILPSCEKHTNTQTERIGPFLDGSIKLIEARSYEPDNHVGS